MKNIVKLTKSIAMVVVAGMLMWSCSQALQVSYDYDSSVNLKQFKTFKVNLNVRWSRIHFWEAS